MYRRISKKEAPKSNLYNKAVERVNLVMTPSEKQKLWKMANEAQLTLCEFIRRRVFGQEYRAGSEVTE